MAKTSNNPSYSSFGSSGGPEDPMVEQRLIKLEERSIRVDAIMVQLAPKINEMVGALSQLPKASDYGALRADIAEIKGKMSNLPSTWQLMTFTIGSVLAAAGLAFTIARYLSPVLKP